MPSAVLPPPARNPVPPGASWRTLPAGIWALGFGSLLMDTSSELIHSVLPLFLVTSLGTSVVAVGLIEGVAEATAAFTKVFSGALSDYLGKRKWLLVFGYALAAVSKPIFPLAGSAAWVFGARFADRIGKGIRGAPRDALVADITPPSMRGAAYGLRQALDSIGAVLGPALAVALMLWSAGDYRKVMAFAVVPACLAVIVLAFYVREPDRARSAPTRERPLTLSEMFRLPVRYWLVVLLGGFFTLARFSEAFLVLRGQSVGLAVSYVPIVLVVMNVAYASASYPAGAAGDRLSARLLLIGGLVLLMVADLALAAAQGPLLVLVGAMLWGLHMALTQGLLSKLVADTVPAALVGTGFGVFNLASGVSLIAASVIAGVLWSEFGPAATFTAGALLAAGTAIAVPILAPQAAADPTLGG